MYQCNKTMQNTINYDNITKQNTEEHNPNWQRIFNHPYRI